MGRPRRDGYSERAQRASPAGDALASLDSPDGRRDGPAYLIAGTDTAKIDATRARLRARAEREGGAAALEIFEPARGRGAPDHEALLAAIPAMSLTELAPLSAGRRRRALARAPARGGRRGAGATCRPTSPSSSSPAASRRRSWPRRSRRPAARCTSSRRRGRASMPRALVAEAERLGFRLEPGRGPAPGRADGDRARSASTTSSTAWRSGRARAARSRRPTSTRWSPTPPRRRSGRSPTRCSNATPSSALAIAERLISQGENVTGLIYGLASRLRKACAAAAQLEEGVPPKQVEAGLGMHPYAAKQLVAPARGRRASRTSARRRSRSPTSRSGAAAAPSTATSWR